MWCSPPQGKADNKMVNEQEQQINKTVKVNVAGRARYNGSV